MKTFPFALVCLTLVGSTSSVLGELPPLLTESFDGRVIVVGQQRIDIVPSPIKEPAPAAATRLDGTTERPTPPSIEQRKLDYGRLERKLRILYPNCQVFLIPMAHKVIVRGQCPNADDAAHVLNIVRAESAKLEPIPWQTPFVLDGNEPAVLTLEDLFRLKRDDLAAARVLNELRVDATVPDVHEVAPVAQFPTATRCLPPLLSNLLMSESHCATPTLSPSNVPRGLAGPPICVPASPSETIIRVAAARSSATSSEDPFQFHLSRAEEQLRAAGLTDEANQFHAMHQSFSAQHAEALLIARKEAQLRSLQDEIAQLKQAHVSNATEVSLRIRLVEVAKSDETWKVIGPLLGDVRRQSRHESMPNAATMRGTLDGDAIHRALDQLTQSGAVKVVAEPCITLANGRPGSLHHGGEIVVPGMLGTGEQPRVALRQFGTSIQFRSTAHGDLIRLFLQADYTRREVAAKQTDAQPAGARRITTAVEMRSGQTLVLSGLKCQRAVAETPTPGVLSQIGNLISDRVPSDSEETEMLVLITPETIRPLGIQTPLRIPGFEVPPPHPQEPKSRTDIDGKLNDDALPKPRPQ